MSALDAMKLFARHVAGDTLAAHDHPVFFGADLDVLARETGHFGGENETVGGFRQIDRRRPAGRVVTDDLTELLVPGEQVAERIPTGVRHGKNRSMFWSRVAVYATIARIYRHNMASSIQATRLRKGMLIKVGNDLFRILELHHLTPGNKRAHIQCRMRNIRTMLLSDYKFRAEEDVERAMLDEREMQYLYNDGDAFYFMDTSSYEQIHITSEALGDSKDYLIAEMLIRVEFYDVEPVGIELPPTVDLTVKETVPGIKGATASAQIKPATLETGLVVNVPSFINEGDKIRINTETGEYQSRV